MWQSLAAKLLVKLDRLNDWKIIVDTNKTVWLTSSSDHTLYLILFFSNNAHYLYKLDRCIKFYSVDLNWSSLLCASELRQKIFVTFNSVSFSKGNSLFCYNRKLRSYKAYDIDSWGECFKLLRP